MFRRMTIVITLLAFAFTGCAGLNASLKDAYAQRANPMEALATFSITDLEAAVKLAEAGQDDAALMCYSFVLDEVKAFQARPKAPAGGDTSGPISTIQKFRNGLHGAQSSTSQSFMGKLDLHCAAYRTSVEIDIAKGAALAGSVAASGGANASSLIPALKAIAPLLGLNIPVLP